MEVVMNLCLRVFRLVLCAVISLSCTSLEAMFPTPKKLCTFKTSNADYMELTWSADGEYVAALTQRSENQTGIRIWQLIKDSDSNAFVLKVFRDIEINQGSEGASYWLAFHPTHRTTLGFGIPDKKFIHVIDIKKPDDQSVTVQASNFSGYFCDFAWINSKNLRVSYCKSKPQADNKDAKDALVKSTDQFCVYDISAGSHEYKSPKTTIESEDEKEYYALWSPNGRQCARRKGPQQIMIYSYNPDETTDDKKCMLQTTITSKFLKNKYMMFPANPAMAWSHRGDFFATVTMPKKNQAFLEVFDTTTWKHINIVPFDGFLEEGNQRSVIFPRTLCWSYDDSMIALHFNNRVDVINALSGHCITRIDKDNTDDHMRAVQWHPQTGWLTVGHRQTHAEEGGYECITVYNFNKTISFKGLIARESGRKLLLQENKDAHGDVPMPEQKKPETIAPKAPKKRSRAAGESAAAGSHDEEHDEEMEIIDFTAGTPSPLKRARVTKEENPKKG